MSDEGYVRRPEILAVRDELAALTRRFQWKVIPVGLGISFLGSLLPKPWHVLVIVVMMGIGISGVVWVGTRRYRHFKCLHCGHELRNGGSVRSGGFLAPSELLLRCDGCRSEYATDKKFYYSGEA